MAEDTKVRAKRIIDNICEELDAHDWHYNKIEEKNMILSGAKGDDLPIDITFIADEKLEIIILLSELPIEIPDSKRIETALAVTMLNNILIDGSFDYHIEKGKIYFRMTTSFADTDPSKELMFRMILTSCSIVDDYNDRFLMLSKGFLSLEDFIIKK
jgi:hypothetical protein